MDEEIMYWWDIQYGEAGMKVKKDDSGERFCEACVDKMKAYFLDYIVLKPNDEDWEGFALAVAPYLGYAVRFRDNGSEWFEKDDTDLGMEAELGEYYRSVLQRIEKYFREDIVELEGREDWEGFAFAVAFYAGYAVRFMEDGSVRFGEGAFGEEDIRRRNGKAFFCWGSGNDHYAENVFFARV